jgi:D-glycero-D-manno-heptose 1,7-bisphosphate phosphatase
MSIWKRPEGAMKTGPALFLDRDGVVIADENYLADPGRVRLLPGVAETLVQARDAGYLLVGVSNQSGIGRGYFGIPEFEAVMSRLDELLAAHGVRFDSFHYCPHAPDRECSCRKPLPGMFQEASSLLSLDIQNSWVIGDKESDVAFGRGVGMGAVLVRTGYGARQEEKVRSRWGGDCRVLVADDLPAAFARILQRGRKRS